MTQPYTPHNELGRTLYEIPRTSEDERSGLNEFGFNPHLVREEDVVDYDVGEDGEFVPVVSTRATLAPVSRKPVAKNKPPINTSNMVTVYLHVPGVRIPYQFHEVHILDDKQMVVLVLDSSSGAKMPQFEVTTDTQILLSCDDYPNVLRCEFYGQQFTIGESLQVIVLVLVEEVPK